MSHVEMPFHTGELTAQQRAGAGNVAEWAAPYIRDHMPDQHRTFYQDQPFLVAASSDADGHIWTTIIEGQDGFIQSPDAQTLLLNAELSRHDPLAQALSEQADIGVVGIELATRRRNRLSGRTQKTAQGLEIKIRQSFGNCPQYISARDWWRAPQNNEGAPLRTPHLNADQIARIAVADTLFIGSGQRGAQEHASNGFDASHRGGAPGFTRIVSPSHLRIPDYSGNNFFNTIGNILKNPKIGLLFVDFATGGLLHVTGRAKIDWSPDDTWGSDVLRIIDVTIEQVIDRPSTLALRWSKHPEQARQLKVAQKVEEAAGVTSFYLSATDQQPLPDFKAGQHLPISVAIPSQGAKLHRTYSLSGKSGADQFRITVKREPNGLVSRHLHDVITVGDILEARLPSGDFIAPEGATPLVLVSAGVGLTPMLSMLHDATSHPTARPVWFVHGTRNGQHHALRQDVDRLITTAPQATKQIFYSAPSPLDQQGRDFDIKGRITATHLLALNAGPRADYMLCGPVEFMSELTSGLKAAGIAEKHIHFETF
ncbi:pyridoxamine 5'-phosphate oxidase family protein [Shimia sp. R11_0]|uniref:FAD-binding oxidoreductase n=1 Tax=Shimia sp. R11_0 TaxID=2821096 RepID=UPI001ADAC0F3|nr:pyridoxamine 5'-phosphate oxidase family protein [Shimia sp. R11_0]MBO9479401.1 pyridoxamine 5'-phosphate oxidase family protein [Shimia sp. R11_0]